MQWALKLELKLQNVRFLGVLTVIRESPNKSPNVMKYV